MLKLIIGRISVNEVVERLSASVGTGPVFTGTATAIFIGVKPNRPDW